MSQGIKINILQYGNYNTVRINVKVTSYSSISSLLVQLWTGHNFLCYIVLQFVFHVLCMTM